MKSKMLLIFILTLGILGCSSKQMKTTSIMIDKLDSFKSKEKFLPDSAKFYPGISNKVLRPSYSEKINQAADDFKEVALTKNPTNDMYLQKIKIGLARFNDVVDSEDQDRICFYFEELMDIVGLESSNGLLNEFRYGYDLSKYMKKDNNK